MQAKYVLHLSSFSDERLTPAVSRTRTVLCHSEPVSEERLLDSLTQALPAAYSSSVIRDDQFSAPGKMDILRVPVNSPREVLEDFRNEQRGVHGQRIWECDFLSPELLPLLISMTEKGTAEKGTATFFLAVTFLSRDRRAEAAPVETSMSWAKFLNQWSLWRSVVYR